MTNEEKYILVSLEEDKAKDLANVLSNATSRRILEYLSTKDEASETEVAKELKSPLSTVHYNLQLLRKNGLVETKKFSYSEKGKRIEFYRVVKKFIVIAPKYTRRNLINSVLPLFLISAGIAFIIQWLSNLTTRVSTSNTLMAQDSFQKATAESAPMLVQATTTNYYGYWFLAGAWMILLIYILMTLIKKR
ncbi:MAG: helix-turn-helix domain-containing protein [Nanoarchaeota archaeon]|mgnify:CR=1 FL=1